jgi:hypothetical protein
VFSSGKFHFHSLSKSGESFIIKTSINKYPLAGLVYSRNIVGLRRYEVKEKINRKKDRREKR